MLILIGSYVIYASHDIQNSFSPYGMENTIDKKLLNAEFNIEDKLKKRIEIIKEMAVLDEEALHSAVSAMKYLGIVFIAIGVGILDVTYVLHNERHAHTNRINK